MGKDLKGNWKMRNHSPGGFYIFIFKYQMNLKYCLQNKNKRNGFPSPI